MLTPFLGLARVVDFASARMASAANFASVHAAWLSAGILWPPSQYEAGFLSTAHSETDVDRTVACFAENAVGRRADSGRGL